MRVQSTGRGRHGFWKQSLQEHGSSVCLYQLHRRRHSEPETCALASDAELLWEREVKGGRQVKGQRQAVLVLRHAGLSRHAFPGTFPTCAADGSGLLLA